MGAALGIIELIRPAGALVPCKFARELPLGSKEPIVGPRASAVLGDRFEEPEASALEAEPVG